MLSHKAFRRAVNHVVAQQLSCMPESCCGTTTLVHHRNLLCRNSFHACSKHVVAQRDSHTHESCCGTTTLMRARNMLSHKHIQLPCRTSTFTHQRIMLCRNTIQLPCRTTTFMRQRYSCVLIAVLMRTPKLQRVSVSRHTRGGYQAYPRAYRVSAGQCQQTRKRA